MLALTASFPRGLAPDAATTSTLPRRQACVALVAIALAACAGGDGAGSAGTSAAGTGGDGMSGAGGASARTRTEERGGAGDTTSRVGTGGTTSVGQGDVDGGGPPMPAGLPCDGPEFTPDFVFDDLFVYDGSARFSGTVELPESLAAGDSVQFLLDDSPDPRVGFTNASHPYPLKQASRSITYEITGLETAVYHLAVWVVRRSGVPLGGAPGEGDWYGFFDGTVEAPVQYRGAAAIPIEDGDVVCGIDFGVGPLACLNAYGDRCTRDEECRGTICGFEGGGAVVLHEGACSEGVCRELACESGTAREGSCIGWDK